MKLLTTLGLTAFLASSAFALPGGEACKEAQRAAEAAASAPQTIELAICLDTSGSMNGLIDAARTKIWSIVSDLAQATPQPKLRVALLTFGNDRHLAENGWTNIDVDFTDTLDLVSDKLFALTTNGGTELVGRIVDRATTGLSWSPADASLKVLVVAGNESADQDQVVRYGDASKRAIEKMIVVNSIYCGNPADTLAPIWQDVAKRADGHFAAIDQDNGTLVIATPFDAELTRLSADLNTTYLPFGSGGQWNSANQMRQDANAAGANSAAAAERCVTKGGAMYSNSGWDLVDACKSPDFKLEDVKKEELPEGMRGMTIEACRQHIAEKAKAREEIQAKIKAIGERRSEFLAAETAKQEKDGARSFDRAMRDAIRAQASARGFRFPADPVAEAAPAAPAEPAPVKTSSAG